MKYIWAVVLLTMIAFLQPAVPSGTSFTKKELNLNEIQALQTRADKAFHLISVVLPGYTENSQLFSTTVTVTSYNPLKEQCDSSPLIDSNNKMVMPGTVAIPQAYRKKIGLELGQTILLEGLGTFTVTGHMNKRFGEDAKIDVISFIPKWSKKFGIHKGVKMFWWQSTFNLTGT